MHRLFFASFAATALLLAALILGIGLWVDPFAHFRPATGDSLDRNPAYTLNRALFKIVQLDREMAEVAQRGERLNLLIGDSTSNQIDPAIVAAAAGGRWFNMSYGKATLQENLDLLESILGRYPVGRVVWTVSFQRVQGYRVTNKNEMPRAMMMANYPWLHLFTFESLRASWYVLRKHWFGINFTDPDLDLEEDERIAYNVYKTRVELQGVGWPDEFVARIEEIERRAIKKGVPIAYAIMPVHSKLMELYKTVFADRYIRFRELFAGRCLFDLEAARPGGWAPEQFRDLVHLKQEHRLELSQHLAAACSGPCPSVLAFKGNSGAHR